MSEKLRTIATDWDGTFTDPVAMEEEYRMIVTDYLAEKLGMNVSELGYAMALAVDEVLSNPAEHGWTIDGRVVAYSTDHLRIVQEAAAIVLKLFESRCNIETLGDVRSKMYFETAPKLTTVYKPEAREVIQALLSRADVVVITNSSTAKVQAEVDGLIDSTTRGNLCVRGGANKFVIDQTFTRFPDGFRGTYGFPKPVHLRQRQYFDVLVDIFGDLSRARMMGDNGLLDLAMIDFEDGKTGLVTSAFSMPWEKKYWDHPPRRLSASLAEVAEWIVK